METLRAKGELPTCARCGELVRPNILMFGDGWWDGVAHRRAGGAADEVAGRPRRRRGSSWWSAARARRSRRCGCSASGSRAARGTLVRINVREPQVPEGELGVPMGALAALEGIDRELGR